MVMAVSNVRWRWWVVGLWLASLLLMLQHLGSVPLRDWDESLVARVALELSEQPFPANLLPTLWGEPYLNKPPLLHGLIAALLAFWPGQMPPPAGWVRLVPAVCSSLVVPLLALVQWRLRPGDHLAALCTAAVALTLLPLMRHGRLAMLDGSLITLMVLQWWALLSLPRQPRPAAMLRWGALAGLAGSGILLLKAPAAPPLLLGALLLLLWERRWTLGRWSPLALGTGAGLLPGLLWHGWHLGLRGGDALRMWSGQGMARVLQTVEGHGGGWSVPVLEVIEGGWPWLALWPLAMVLAWRQRRERWGFWCLGLTVLTAALVLPLRTQLPWYSHLLWPSFVLTVAPLLAGLIRGRSLQPVWLQRWLQAVPLFWFVVGLGLLLAQAWITVPGAIAVPAALALALGGGLLLGPSIRWRAAGAVSLVVLLWCALLALFSGPLWLWELNESWPVPPLAAQLQALPASERNLPLLLDGQERPSLEWLLDRPVQAGRLTRLLRRAPQDAVVVISDAMPDALNWSCQQRTHLPQGPDLFVCRRAVETTP